MRQEEIHLAIELAAREGWNPGRHDASSFHAADPHGFLIAEVDGAFAGCISAVAYGDDFGFIGLYIVQPAWRGQGIGWQLWTRAMQRLSGRLIGLDGVPAQQENYGRSGFQLAWQNARFAGPSLHGTAITPPAVVPLADVDFAALVADDRRVFPAPRDAFLRAWIAQPESRALAYVDDGRLAGWGVIRRCREGHKIGPLVADTRAMAEALYSALCAQVGGLEPVFLDVPLPNANAVAMVEGLGLQRVFETARMYTGEAPPCEIERLYGITSFELG
jgi:ribosomal protein S18 acetylase RimI-like enzyme